MGIWAFCVDDASGGGRTCDRTGHGYSVGELNVSLYDRLLSHFTDITGPQRGQVATVRSSWTKGLVVHPVGQLACLLSYVLSMADIRRQRRA